MNNEYTINEEDVSYFEMRKYYDPLVQKICEQNFKEAIEKTLKDLISIKCPKVVRNPLIDDLNSSISSIINMKISKVSIPDLNAKYFDDLKQLGEDLKNNNLDFGKVIVLQVPTINKYFYFAEKEECLKFLKIYSDQYLIEIIKEDEKQNFSMIIPVKATQDETKVMKIIDKLTKVIIDIHNHANIIINKDNDQKMFWLHVTNIYFENYREALNATYKILKECEGDFNFPQPCTERELGCMIIKKMISKNKFDMQNLVSTYSTPEEILGQMKPVFNGSNNHINYINVIGPANINVSKNGNITNIPLTIENWIDNNPPQLNESAGDYWTRVKKSTKENITAQKLTKILEQKGYKKSRKAKENKRTWKKE